MRISNNDQFPLDPILGAGPQIMWGADAVDGTASPWKDWPIGTLYIRQDVATDTNVKMSIKIDDADDSGDWLVIATV